MNSYSYIESDEEMLKELLDKLDETIDLLTQRNIYYKKLTNELKRQLRLNDNVLRTMFLEVSKKQTV